METIRHDHWAPPSLCYSRLEGLAHIHYDNLYIRTVFSEILLDGFFPPVGQNVNWFPDNGIGNDTADSSPYLYPP